MTTEKIKIQHAEAWIDSMPAQPTAGGTLHVFVELVSNNHGRHFLKKMIPQGVNPAILMLEIKISLLDIFIFNPQHLTYTEGLSTAGQYSTIELYSNGKRIETITEIPIVS
jgi:hypothetical protein